MPLFKFLLDGVSASQQAGLLKAELSVDMLVLALSSTMHGLTEMLLDNLLVKKMPHPLLLHLHLIL